MSDEYFEELEEWKKAVGTAILSFGEIELITLRCLERFPQDNIYRLTSSLPLARRIDLVFDILAPRRSEPLIPHFLESLSRAKKLAEMRNVFAHNPLMAEVFEHRDTGNLTVQNLIRSARNTGKAIDLASMKALAEEAEGLASELWIALEEILQTGDMRA